MIISMLYRANRARLSMPAVLLRRDTAKDAELLVLRHENAVLRTPTRRSGPLRACAPVLAGRVVIADTAPQVGQSLPRHSWNAPGLAPTLVAKKWDYADQRRRTGRPPTAAAVQKLIARLAPESPRRGHQRIQSELARLCHPIASSTV
ncbi:integrase [Streptomyces sp. NBC_01280]|uniref:integrase n=1 Tax=Streptomyces sp. NBC_01280 TaxID=2903810 RepID=UPI002E30C070|nr:integrase [Streptomyces sp. NBC_01280]